MISESQLVSMTNQIIVIGKLNNNNDDDDER